MKLMIALVLICALFDNYDCQKAGGYEGIIAERSEKVSAPSKPVLMQQPTTSPHPSMRSFNKGEISDSITLDELYVWLDENYHGKYPVTLLEVIHGFLLKLRPYLECLEKGEKCIIPEEGKCTPKDSDSCLQASPGWNRLHKCASKTKYCSSWGKDLRRCCPVSCNTGRFTEEMCNSFQSSGTCLYPNTAQCPENRSL